MKRFLFIVITLFSINVFASTSIHTSQDNYLNMCLAGGGPCAKNNVAIPNTTYTGVFSVANPQWTQWIQVNTKRTVVFDVTLVDADSSITALNMDCFTAQDSLGVVTDGNRTVVYVSTAVTGTTTSVPSTISQVSITGGAPGSSSWTWSVTNLPGSFVMCRFTAAGAVTAVVDTIAINARGINP